MSVNGLGPYPTYRESGVEWLGKVPEHWELRRGKTVFRCIDERSETGSEELLTVSSGRGIVPRDSTSVTMFKARSYVGHKLCWPGDLVINSLWAWNRGLGVSRYHGIVSTAYGVYRVRRKARVLPDFIHSLVRSEAFNWELRVRSKGIWISRLQLTDDSFLRAPLPLPPLSEQGAIVRYLEAADRRIRRYIRAKERLVELLEERKRALIHEAVTGRIDVRTGQPYPAYKDSGVEWLGKVPKHWEVKRLKYLTRFVNGFAFKPSEWRDEGTPIIRIENLNGGNAFNYTDRTDLPDELLIQTGDIVFAWSGNRGTSFGSFRWDRDFDGWLNQHIFKLTEYALCRGYFFHLLRAVTKKVEDNAHGIIGLVHITKPALGAIAVPVAPAEEQAFIAAGLDEELAKIDRAARQAVTQIGLLEEYRTRLIADVVTGKLDVREAAARLPETDPLARNRDRADTIRTESNLHSTAQDMMKEASA